MTEIPAALIEAHRNNLKRYCRLLATDLTDLERDYIHRRIAETQRELDRINVRQMELIDHEDRDNLYDVAAPPRIGRRRSPRPSGLPLGAFPKDRASCG